MTGKGFSSTRRNLLKAAGAASALGLAGAAQAQGRMQVGLILTFGDRVAASPPAVWALEQLEKALGARDVSFAPDTGVSDAMTWRWC